MNWIENRFVLCFQVVGLAVLQILLVFLPIRDTGLFYLLVLGVVALSLLTAIQFLSNRKGNLKTDVRLGLIESSLNLSQEVLLVLDDNEKIQAYNASAEKYFPQLSLEAGVCVSSVFPSLVPEEMRRIRQSLITDPDTRREVEVPGKIEPKIYELVFNGVAYQGKNYILIFARDFTREFLREQEFNQTKHHLEQFLEGIPGGTFIKDRSGRVVFQNQKSIYEAMEFPGLLEFISQPVLSRQNRAGGPKELKASSARFPDECREWEIWQFPLVTVGEDLYAGIVMDVSFRRNQERLLAESQAFLEATINQSPIGLIILDGNTASIKVANQGLKRLLGIPEEENLIGRSINFDSLEWKVLSLDRKPFAVDENPIYRAFFHGASSSDRMIIRDRSGNERYVLVNSGPIHDHHNHFIAVMVVFLDITELFKAETDLQILNRELESRVAKRTEELQATNEDLHNTIAELKETQHQLFETEKMASLGNLVAGVAHEINTPIGVSVTAASLLEEKTAKLALAHSEGKMTRKDLECYVETAKQSSSIILSNLERASRLIQSFKLISVDQSTDQLREFKVRDYFLDVYRSLHPPDKRLKLTVQVDGDPDLALRSFPGAFSQILTNLYMNSCIHGFEGRNSGTITTSIRQVKADIEVVYTDNGSGMDEETLRQIFAPFFSTKRNRGGTGLGMHIVYNLVTQKLSGQVVVQSEPGKGTRFTFLFPNQPPG